MPHIRKYIKIFGMKKIACLQQLEFNKAFDIQFQIYYILYKYCQSQRMDNVQNGEYIGIGGPAKKTSEQSNYLGVL